MAYRPNFKPERPFWKSIQENFFSSPPPVHTSFKPEKKEQPCPFIKLWLFHCFYSTVLWIWTLLELKWRNYIHYEEERIHHTQCLFSNGRCGSKMFTQFKMQKKIFIILFIRSTVLELETKVFCSLIRRLKLRLPDLPSLSWVWKSLTLCPLNLN